MSKLAAEWGDQEILAATVRGVDGPTGKQRFVMELPIGDAITSEWMNPDDINGKVMISWCEAVRQTIGARMAAREAEMVAKRAKRKAGGHSTAPTVDSTQSTPVDQTKRQASAIDTTDKTSDETDADEYAHKLLAIYYNKLETLKKQGAEILEQIAEAEKQHKKWKRIAESLHEDTC